MTSESEDTSVGFHSYADDTWVYIAIFSNDTVPIDDVFKISSRGRLGTYCSPTRRQILVIGPESKRHTLRLYQQNLLRKWNHFDLSFMPHIKNETYTGFYNFKKVGSLLTFHAGGTLNPVLKLLYLLLVYFRMHFRALL